MCEKSRDEKLIDYLSALWDSEESGAWIMNQWFPNTTGSFRDAVEARMANSESPSIPKNDIVIQETANHLSKLLQKDKSVTFTVSDTDNFGWSRQQYENAPRVMEILRKRGFKVNSCYNFGTLVYTIKDKDE